MRTIIDSNHMGEVAKELKKYFEVSKNRYIFCGKFTLNQLAIELWEELGEKSMDASYISRIISGERLCTAEHITALCKVLNLTASQKEGLQNALQKDKLFRAGFLFDTIPEVLTAKRTVIDTLTYSASTLHTIGSQGQLSLAIEYTEALIAQITSQLSNETDEPYRIQLTKLLASVYYEKVTMSMKTTPDEGVSYLIKEQLRIAEQTEDADIQAKAHLALAIYYYNRGNFLKDEEHKSYYKKSIEALHNVSSHPKNILMQLYCWQLFAFNAAYLADEDTFREVEKTIIKTIREKEISIDSKQWALSSVARGQAIFGDTKALKTLELIQHTNKTTKVPNPYRYVAELRNEVEILEKITQRKDRHTLTLAKKGKEFSELFGYHRYQEYFQNFLQR